MQYSAHLQQPRGEPQCRAARHDHVEKVGEEGGPDGGQGALGDGLPGVAQVPSPQVIKSKYRTEQLTPTGWRPPLFPSLQERRFRIQTRNCSSCPGQVVLLYIPVTDSRDCASGADLSLGVLAPQILAGHGGVPACEAPHQLGGGRGQEGSDNEVELSEN